MNDSIKLLYVAICLVGGFIIYLIIYRDEVILMLFALIDIVFVHPLRKRLIRKLFLYHIHLPYPCMEFGTYRGKTAKVINKYKGERELHLFDSFTGIPLDWTKFYKKGSFNLNGIAPDSLPKDAIVHTGFFNETIAKLEPTKVSFINIDCDLYESAHDILFGLNDSIVPGTVLLFDEYLRGKHIAFNEWLCQKNRVCIMVGKASYLQVAYKVVV